MKKYLLLCVILVVSYTTFANDGYDLWLKYEKLQNTKMIEQYKNKLQSISISGGSPTIQKAKGNKKSHRKVAF